VNTEGAGVLRWMLDGLADYQTVGLRIPDVVDAATSAYRHQSDTVAAFLDESGIVVDPVLSMTASELLAVHGDWYETAGISDIEKAHYQRVVDVLKTNGATHKRHGKDRTRTWIGVGEQGGDRR
jgi:phage/plasmid-associated DNA primase